MERLNCELNWTQAETNYLIVMKAASGRQCGPCLVAWLESWSGCHACSASEEGPRHHSNCSCVRWFEYIKHFSLTNELSSLVSSDLQYEALPGVLIHLEPSSSWYNLQYFSFSLSTLRSKMSIWSSQIIEAFSNFQIILHQSSDPVALQVLIPLLE